MPLKIKLLLTALSVAGVLGAGAAVADPSDDVAWVFRVKINDVSKMDEAVALMDMVSTMSAAHEGTLVWESARVGSTVYGYQRFENDAALFSHLETMAPLYPQMAQAWTTELLVPTTPLSEEVSAVLTQFGALPADQVIGNTY